MMSEMKYWKGQIGLFLLALAVVFGCSRNGSSDASIEISQTLRELYAMRTGEQGRMLD
ncbi:MAG: hypothetical protein IJL17_10405 [Kiritimatiellae bacterium]|nr:hypothetical protein [Kiritimatiellia bacterium]